MCLAVPAEIKSIEGHSATVDYGGVSRKANITLVDAKVGDYVIVHAGYAIQVLDKEEAEKTLEIFKEMLDLENAGA
jgi:hydrogenase expression/formation protein HypC